MAPKIDFGNSKANDFGSGGAFALKTVKGDGPVNRNNAPISGRRDSGSPTNEAGPSKLFCQANQASPSSSKLTPRASKESNLDAQTPNLRRIHSGVATLGAKESDEEIESEDGAASKRSDRSNGSANSRGSHSSKRSGESQESGNSGSRRPETSGGRTRPSGPRSQPEPTRLTKSALKSLHTDQIRRTLQEESPQPRAAKVRIARKDRERKEKKSKEAKKKVKNEIRVEMDHERGIFVRRGVYRDGTKPWQQRFGRFGDPHEDLLSMAGLREFYEKVKRNFYWSF